VEDQNRVVLVCAVCGRIHRPDGTWVAPDCEDSERLAAADVSHGLCQLCSNVRYPQHGGGPEPAVHARKEP
jgi:hypothetical protein